MKPLLNYVLWLSSAGIGIFLILAGALFIVGPGTQKVISNEVS